jgi:hypothetical protein
MSLALFHSDDCPTVALPDTFSADYDCGCNRPTFGIVADPANERNPHAMPEIVDDVAYDCEGADGLAWDCPECWVGGTEPGGEDVHNRYAHRAEVTFADGVYYVKPASAWGGTTGDEMARAAAQRFPGLTFAGTCECDFSGPMEEADAHEYGCGATYRRG